MITIVSWNLDRRREAVSTLREMGADLALLQEVGPGVAEELADAVVGGPLRLEGNDHRPAVVKLSNRVAVEPLRPQRLPLSSLEENEIAVSDPATLAVARVTPGADSEAPFEPFLVASLYARWLTPHPLARREPPPARELGTGAIRIYADASAHRIVSDLSTFIGHTNPATHRLLAAGDLNTLYGATEESRLETPARAQTIFDRLEALGFEFAGPQWPAGRRSDPPSAEVPPDTRNVPTFLTPARLREMRDAPADGAVSGNQLDYVFASRGFHERVRVRALNAPGEWGPSDHCRLLIEVD